MGDITNNTPHKETTMTYKIISLAIDALIQLSLPANHSGQFKSDLDDAIKSLEKVKKYL
jgi:hypothetical protein